MELRVFLRWFMNRSHKLLVWVCSLQGLYLPKQAQQVILHCLKWRSERAAWQQCCSHPLRKNTRARIRFCYMDFLCLTWVKAFSLCLSSPCAQCCSEPFKTPTWQLSWWSQSKGKQEWLFLTKATSQEWGTSAQNTMWEFTATLNI